MHIDYYESPNKYKLAFLDMCYGTISDVDFISEKWYI